ncbi:hypothetical protein FA95DRAFT_1014813 [Auriscalpium vulgare]|uniref:Uncharacterized protein n=1 Tax=Auriscalpium vulgare TaxID=40419 RepID=A0ACB8RWP8_9AGAM|nr:hypothetical protein FA95DRAFT_1014813 [Auriscalpium vulgare]
MIIAAVHSSVLLDLPDDLLHALLLLVDDTKSTLACLATCRRLKTLGENSLQLQYKIELGASGMCEGPDARHLDVSEKLQRLRKYRAAWARDITLEELPFAPAVVGRFTLHTSVTTLVSERFEAGGLRVYVQQMPSVLRGIEERHWTIKLPGPRSWGVFAVDASQDLLIAYATEYQRAYPLTIHMLSLSTGEPHSSAFCASKEFHCLHLEVFGDYCAAQGWEKERPCVIVWDWKTQSPEVKLFPPQPETDFCFTFLDGVHIAIMASNPPVILVYSFGVEKSEYLPTTFTLPPDTLIDRPRLTNCTSVAGSDHAGIFHPAPSTRMLSVAFTPPSSTRRFLLNIPADTLLVHLQAVPATVQWADWGPAGSRLAPRPIFTRAAGDPSSTMCAIALAIYGSVGPDGEPVTVLADFRPSRVARARRRGVGLVEEETPATGDDLGGLIEARLPYVAKEFTTPTPWTGQDPHYDVIMCEDQLFVFEMSEGHDSFVKAWACTI